MALHAAEARHGIEQGAGVGVLRARENLCDRALLDLAAGEHHDDPVGDLGDHGHVVGDEQDRHPDLLLQELDQVEDLGLDRDVEGGRGLVGDQQRRAAGERHRDHRALAHAARELVRVLVELALGLGQADELQHLERLGSGFFLRSYSGGE